jgi:hypothetical protein
MIDLDSKMPVTVSPRMLACQPTAMHNSHLDSNLLLVQWAFTKTDGEFFIIFDAVS